MLFSFSANYFFFISKTKQEIFLHMVIYFNMCTVADLVDGEGQGVIIIIIIIIYFLKAHHTKSLDALYTIQ